MYLNPGHKIRDYEIIRLLGEGGMGEVYLAQEALLSRQVAIKRLSPQFTKDEQFSQRFINEARIQAQLKHDNIVDVISFFEEGGIYYMVLEYAPGITLRDLINQIGPIPEKRCLKMFRQIVAGLSHAHTKGIVHRDIKPSNIMIDTGNDDHIKIMDFGIARIMSELHITQTGTKLGTVYYMSPEQVIAQKDIDHRSDIYSAGVVLYEMLSGVIPYRIDTNSDFLIQREIVDVDIPDPREIYSHISDDTVNMLRAMTQKKREERVELFGIISHLNNDERLKETKRSHHLYKAPEDGKSFNPNNAVGFYQSRF